MVRTVSNALFYTLFTVGIVGFLLMLSGFARLIRQAWQMPDTSAGAGLIAKGALCGVVFFAGLFILTLLAR